MVFFHISYAIKFLFGIVSSWYAKRLLCFDGFPEACRFSTLRKIPFFQCCVMDRVFSFWVWKKCFRVVYFITAMFERRLRYKTLETQSLFQLNIALPCWATCKITLRRTKNPSCWNGMLGYFLFPQSWASLPLGSFLLSFSLKLEIKVEP